jgi:hypothetical protein
VPQPGQFARYVGRRHKFAFPCVSAPRAAKAIAVGGIAILWVTAATGQTCLRNIGCRDPSRRRQTRDLEALVNRLPQGLELPSIEQRAHACSARCRP